MTVSRTDGKALALALRRLATGRITNYEFEDAIPFSTLDFGVKNVARQSWYLYSDLREYRLRGTHSLTREGRREVARWLLFLRTEREYEWQPRKPGPGDARASEQQPATRQKRSMPADAPRLRCFVPAALRSALEAIAELDRHRAAGAVGLMLQVPFDALIHGGVLRHDVRFVPRLVRSAGHGCPSRRAAQPYPIRPARRE
jgi:hypothetical protein